MDKSDYCKKNTYAHTTGFDGLIKPSRLSPLAFIALGFQPGCPPTSLLTMVFISRGFKQTYLCTSLQSTVQP